MKNPAEQNTGKEIVFASAQALTKRYTEDEFYRLVKLKSYAQGVENAGYILSPSSLTANVMMNDWAIRRLRSAARTSGSMSPESRQYITDATANVINLMGALIMIKYIDGVSDPWSALKYVQEKYKVDAGACEAFMDFTNPVRTDLQQGVSDEHLIELLKKAADTYKKSPDFRVIAPGSEDLTFQTHRSLYPLSKDYLANRSTYSKKRLVLMSNWF